MARKKRIAKKWDVIWTIPDDLWPTLEAILLEYYPHAKTGRPRCDMRKLVDGIIFRMRTGVQWNQLPREYGSDTTVHDWFQRFVRDGVFTRLWSVLIGSCEELNGVSWEWQAADGVLNKARFGGISSGKTRPIEPNRGRNECSSSKKMADRWVPSSPPRTLTTASSSKA